MDVSQEMKLATQKAKITVIGVGGGGGNAVQTMINTGIKDVTFICANTDAQALARSNAEIKIQIGERLTKGLGAGGKPEVGRASAQENIEQLKDVIKDSEMVFITAGMGGGTGTGAAPVIAQTARDMNILTVGVVTFPFKLEGPRRAQTATEGIKELRENVHSLIVIPNERLNTLKGPKSTFKDMLKLADSVLCNAVGGIADLITRPGLINLDFADVRTAMIDSGGMAMMGIGVAKGENKAIEAARHAISSTLLDDISIVGAKAILINITSNENLTMDEFQAISDYITECARQDGVEPNIFVGSTFDNSLEDEIRISVIATGIEPQDIINPKKPTPPRKPGNFPGGGQPITPIEKPVRPDPAIVLNEGRPSPIPGYNRGFNSNISFANPSDASFEQPAIYRQRERERNQQNQGTRSSQDFTFDVDDFDLPSVFRKQAN